jgi:hypothetical protein
MEHHEALSRGRVLQDALTVWAALLDGMPLSDVPPETVDAVMSTVGGQLVTADGRLQRITELRRLLRLWLAPRPGAPQPDPGAEEYDVFLVSWGLSVHSEPVARWRTAGSPWRLDPAPHLRRAAGWGADQPAPAGFSTAALDDGFRSMHDLSPQQGSAAARLVESAVAALLNVGVRFGEPKPSRLDADMRRLMTARVARQLRLFDAAIIDGSVTPTVRVTRLAFALAVGVTLGAYAETVLGEADEAVRTVCEDVRALWAEPPDLVLLRSKCIDYDILDQRYRDGDLDGLGVQYADFRAIFRTFAEEGAEFAGQLRIAATATDAEVRRVGALLELAIADVRENAADGPASVADQAAAVIDEVARTLASQRETPEMLHLQEKLRAGTASASRVRAGEQATFLEELLDKLASAHKIGSPIVSTANAGAGWDEIDRLVHSAYSFLDGGKNYGPEWLIHEFRDRLPLAVRTLTSADKAAKEGLDHVAAAEARWQLLVASGQALAQRPDVVGGLVVAGSFAELGWAVANEQNPDRIRAVYEPLQSRLREETGSQLAYDLVGPVTRILRSRPLADNKHDNFDIAQRVAHDAVRYGSRMLYEATHTEAAQTVSRIAAALTGFQLSLLQAGGVFVRSAEAELTFAFTGWPRDKQARHGAYMRDLASASLTYTNLAVQRLKDVRDLEATGLLSGEALNYPATSAASTAAMGMRTLLLWAMLHLAYPDGNALDARPLIKATPGQFHDMLRLRHLSKLNFADMTRIALHYAFLSGDLRHPATGARDCHPDTPEHLRPRRSGKLDLNACGRYLIKAGFDTGVLDVIQVERVRRVLDETSGGLYGEWLAKYDNKVRRRPEKFRRGDVSRIAFAQARDATVGW